MDETLRLARHASTITAAQLPAAVIDKARQHVLDTVGVMIRARHAVESSTVFTRTVEELCGEGGVATAAGHRRLYPPQYAALLNGAYGHSIEFDDTHGAGSIHPGCTVIPAALAAGEAAAANGASFIAAVVAGYEMACRVSLPLPPTAHLNRGFHPTATCGTFGAAAAAAVATGCDAAQMRNAIGLCVSMAAGTMQSMDDSSWNKRFHAGMASHNGVVAARFARNGALGTELALEGRRGFWNAYGTEPRFERAFEALGERWEIMETGFKPYPTCRSTHSPIDLILAMMRDEQLAAREIESMQIGLSVKGVDLVGAPEDFRRKPKDDVDAPFSMHWTAAVAVLKGRMTWNEYELVHDPEVLAMAQRITVGVDPQCTALWPGHFAARVVIHARGRRYERFVEDAKGDAQIPMTWADLEDKFHSLAEVTFPKATRDRIVATVRAIDEVDHLSRLTSLLRP